MRATESGLETRIWRFIKRERLPLPLRQHEIKEGREFIARPDFAYPAEKVAIEGHSYRHHSGRAAWEKDLLRHKRLTAHDWVVVYVTRGDVDFRPKETAEQVRAALQSQRERFSAA